jgi:glycerol-3-phosphate acyltransferase PlsY
VSLNLILSILAAGLIGYLLGAIPFGLIVTRLAGLGDIRAIGSGNIGATNVLRTGRRWLALATLFADALKGAAAVLIGGLFGPFGAVAGGLGALLGHVYPVWLGFRGGKGVATYIGILIATYWPAVLVFAAAWLVTAAVFRFSSLGALVATVAVPVALYLFGQDPAAGLFVVLSLIVWLKHIPNIRRLLAGEESRIGACG